MKKSILIYLLFFLLLSCSKERKFLSDIRKNSVIDLANYSKVEFDYIVVFNMGDLALKEYLKLYQINTSNLKHWLGEKILFIRSNIIVAQYNLPYPVSERNRDYIWFFEYNFEPDYFIFFKGNTKFNVEKRSSVYDQYYDYYLRHIN